MKKFILNKLKKNYKNNIYSHLLQMVFKHTRIILNNRKICQL